MFNAVRDIWGLGRHDVVGAEVAVLPGSNACMLFAGFMMGVLLERCSMLAPRTLVQRNRRYKNQLPTRIP